LSARKNEQLAWEATGATSDLTVLDFAGRIRPALQGVSLFVMQAVTGLSLSSYRASAAAA